MASRGCFRVPSTEGSFKSLKAGTLSEGHVGPSPELPIHPDTLQKFDRFFCCLTWPDKREREESEKAFTKSLGYMKLCPGARAKRIFVPWPFPSLFFGVETKAKDLNDSKMTSRALAVRVTEPENHWEEPGNNSLF